MPSPKNLPQGAPRKTGYFWDKIYEKYPDNIRKYPMKNIWIIS